MHVSPGIMTVAIKRRRRSDGANFFAGLSRLRTHFSTRRGPNGAGYLELRNLIPGEMSGASAGSLLSVGTRGFIISDPMRQFLETSICPQRKCIVIDVIAGEMYTIHQTWM